MKPNQQTNQQTNKQTNKQTNQWNAPFASTNCYKKWKPFVANPNVFATHVLSGWTNAPIVVPLIFDQTNRN